MNLAAFLWLVLLLAFLYVEAHTVALVSMWFAGGAFVALIAALFHAAPGVQIVLFLGVSGILLTLLRPFVRKFIAPKLTKTNVDAVVGAQGVVQVQIENDISQGQVKIGPMEWTARSTTGEILVPGTKVTVDRIEGVKVFVSTVTESEV